ncbi:MAG: hypothetical protein WC314_17160 [Vulcanimicrobiota bacterium]
MTAALVNSSRASTLAEVLIGMVVLSIAVLALLGILIQSSYLDRADATSTEVLAIAEGLLEVSLAQVQDRDGFQGIAAISLTPADNPDYLYERRVSELTSGLKKLSISLYYADPGDPTLPDPQRGQDGHALTLSVTVTEPTL